MNTMLTREEMLDRVIKKLGHENHWTIWFSRLIEDSRLNDESCLQAMQIALSMPCNKEE